MLLLKKSLYICIVAVQHYSNRTFILPCIILKKLNPLRRCKAFYFVFMEKKTISNEVLKKIKTLPRIDYLAYLELIKQGQVKRIVRLKCAKTIFFDEKTGLFLYLNPYHKQLSKCGTFKNNTL